MGVQGLWQLLDPVGRPVNLDLLQNKVLGVDASILLHQSVHGFRDRQGNPLPNSHLLGIFHRVCKLLFYNIKPVFVFDGKVPVLKKQTVASRRERREGAVRDSAKTHRQILENYLKSKSVKEVLNSKVPSTSKQSTDTSLNLTSSSDVFELPPLPSHLNNEESDEDNGVGNNRLWNDYEDFRSIDFESEDFKNLPLEIQHEYLSEIKERSKSNVWFNDGGLPEDSEEIGSRLVQRLLERRRIRKRLDEVKKELDANITGSFISNFQGDILTGPSEDRFAVARRIVSEDFAHYLFLKNIPSNVNKRKVATISLKDEAKETEELNDKKTAFSKQKDSKKHLPPFLVTNNSEVNNDKLEDTFVHIEEEVNIDYSANETEIAKWIQLQDDESLSCQSQTNLQVKIENNVSETKKVNEELEVLNDPKINLSSDDDSSSVEEMQEKSSAVASKSNYKLPILIGNENSPVSEPKLLGSITVIEDEELISSDDEFIEVGVDSGAKSNDELFPLSTFVKTKEDEKLIDIPTVEQVTLPEEPQEETISAIEQFLLNPPKGVEELKILNEELDKQLKSLVQERGRQERIAVSITDQMNIEGQELLRLFGVPYVVSPAEAEAQCAALETLGLTEGTITDDSDVWLFGARRVYKNFFENDRDPLVFCETDINIRFNLNRSRLIAIAFLTGSDYTMGVKGIGVVKALEILGEFPEIDGFESLKKFRNWWDTAHMQKVAPSETKVKQFLRKIELNDGFPCEIVYKAYTEPLVDTSTEAFSWSTPDLDLLRQFAKIKLNWSLDKVNSMLLPMMKRLSSNKQKQMLLTQFNFSSVARDQGTVSHHSKRLVRAINKVKNSPNKSLVDDGNSKKLKKRNSSQRRSGVNINLSKSKSNEVVAKTRRPGKSRQQASNSTSTANSSGDLELSESSDSSSTLCDDEVVVRTKRKR